MKKLSKIIIPLFLFFLFPKIVNAQVPQINLSCTKTGDPEFNSTRPYQAAPCGNASKARFCSNRLVIFEDFQMRGRADCVTNGTNRDFECSPDFFVEPHNLKINLDDSMFPIMGNTEDNFDDAQKVNEYVNWYLNGVIDKAENTSATDDQIVNFSGPVRKIIPSMIQDAQRIKTIKTATDISTFIDDSTGETVTQAENHDQFVVEKERLSSWKGDLSLLRAAGNLVGGIANNLTGGLLNGLNLGSAWDQRTPPLPWDDGTVEDNPETKETESVPFKSQVLYEKAYNEWQGKSCAIIPIIGLQCLDIKIPTILGSFDVISNKYASLWHFVPLSNNSDKKGANYLLTDDGPSYDPSNGTEIVGAAHDSYTNAPLYFAHTKEVNDLSELLNSSYTPKDVESVPLPTTTELNNCSAAVVRTNKGDNLFPGDKPEISVTGVHYTITKTQCHEEFKEEQGTCDVKDPVTKRTIGQEPCTKIQDTIDCPAEVGVVFELGTKTPYANEIFAKTVADSGSTFRKIFPKVEKGAPVSCIADIPTVTSVTYDHTDSQIPKGGTLNFKQQARPIDSGGEGMQLTFPHIGSVYEYFLNGIQTALRPKGYGDPIADGQLCYSNECTPITDLPKATGSCALNGPLDKVGVVVPTMKSIVEAAAETYKVPPSLILGVMYGEGAFNTNFYSNEANVKDLASCRPIPYCDADADQIKSIVPFIKPYWENLAKSILPDLQKIDPKKTKADPCNLLDATFGLAKDLSQNKNGGNFGGTKTCYNIDLNTGSPSSPVGCSWSNQDYETAIKVWENGFEPVCATEKDGCANGGDAAFCSSGGDTCEKFGDSGNTSHNACVFDVATSGGGSGNRN